VANNLENGSRLLPQRLRKAFLVGAWERAMLQTLSRKIRECYSRAEQCRQPADTALTEESKADYLDMEHRWLSLSRSYEFAERLSSFTGTPFWVRKPVKR
jgi:hypothetical protein